MLMRYPLKPLRQRREVCTKMNCSLRQGVTREVRTRLKRNGECFFSRLPVKAEPLRMIRFPAQEGIEKGLVGRLLAAAVRLNRNKDGVNFSELLRIIQPQHPAAIRLAVHLKNAGIGSGTLCPQTWNALAFLTPGS